MRAYERFINYAKVFTPSDENSPTCPSTACQLDLCRMLEAEMKQIGFSDVRSENGYLYGVLPATPGLEKAPGLGLIAHMDTVSEFCDHAPVPVVTENYDGKDFRLPSGRILPGDSVGIGKTVISSDGTTVLGADDKAGIAEILTLAERLIAEKIPHGKIAVGFTPDEEIGRGADLFDVKGFGVPFAFTLDGGSVGEIEFENFNASKAVVDFVGNCVHPGGAKNVMRNASAMACEFQSLLPEAATPEHTEHYEGFIHLTDVSGQVGKAQLCYIVRDHDAEKLAEKEELLRATARFMEAKYGAGTVSVSIRGQYRNMREKIEPFPFLIEEAKEAISAVGLVPCISPIRGGTDGARLSFMGMPTPNLGTGMRSCHGPCEHVFVEDMDLAVEILMYLTKKFSKTQPFPI